MPDWGYCKFKWKGGRASWAVRSAIADGLERAAAVVKRTMRRLLNTPYPPASVAGESPHKRTGNLQGSIDVWVNRKTLQVYVGPAEIGSKGKPANYGLWLEFGTRKMDPRPFMKRALVQEQTRVKNTLERAAKIAFNKFGR